MKFKFRADIVLSREMTVEAQDLKEAMDKVQNMLEAPDAYKDLTFSRVDYHMLEPKAKC